MLHSHPIMLRSRVPHFIREREGGNYCSQGSCRNGYLLPIRYSIAKANAVVDSGWFCFTCSRSSTDIKRRQEFHNRVWRMAVAFEQEIHHTQSNRVSTYSVFLIPLQACFPSRAGHWTRKRSTKGNRSFPDRLRVVTRAHDSTKIVRS